MNRTGRLEATRGRGQITKPWGEKGAPGGSPTGDPRPHCVPVSVSFLQDPQPRLVQDSSGLCPAGVLPAQGLLTRAGSPRLLLGQGSRPSDLPCPPRCPDCRDHRKRCPSSALPFSEICPQQPGGQGRQTSRCPHPWALPTSHKWFVPELPWAEVTFLPQPQISYLSEQERWHQRYILTHPRRAWPAPTTACCSPHHTGKCGQRVQAALGREPGGRPGGQVGQRVIDPSSRPAGGCVCPLGPIRVTPPQMHSQPEPGPEGSSVRPAGNTLGPGSQAASLPLHPRVNIGLVPRRSRTHCDKGQAELPSFLNSSTIDILGWITDPVWLGLFRAS